MKKLNRRRLVAWGVVGGVLLIMAVAFFPPPAHEIHTSGSSPLDSRLVASDPGVWSNGQVIQPGESIDMIRCRRWQARRSLGLACPDSATLAADFFPNLTQTPKTLYLPWQRCYLDGALWAGFNLEYQPIRRTLVIHCYTAEAWIHWRQVRTAMWPQPEQLMLVVSTKSLPVGDINIVEDDRVERYAGDISTEFPRGTATIS
jgi:hypothetical protein